MAKLRAYFEYTFCSITRGIPRVTLEGEKDDWEKILRRLEKLKGFGLETIAWYHLLVPVISHFVQVFDDPDALSNVSFWKRVAHFECGECGPSYDSGWITAFCRIESTVAPESLTAKSFWETYGVGSTGCSLTVRVSTR
ncbi:hypothetical protein B0H14DRAFT_2802223 [Mycena olivaceomarginata]|nr:hypothetical protein B0H14DRAFT_2802223 [Mycena olivaceomarginata]